MKLPAGSRVQGGAGCSRVRPCPPPGPLSHGCHSLPARNVYKLPSLVLPSLLDLGLTFYQQYPFLHEEYQFHFSRFSLSTAEAFLKHHPSAREPPTSLPHCAPPQTPPGAPAGPSLSSCPHSRPWELRVLSCSPLGLQLLAHIGLSSPSGPSCPGDADSTYAPEAPQRTYRRLVVKECR